MAQVILPQGEFLGDAVEVHGVTILVDPQGYAARVPLHQVESGLDLENGYTICISAEHLAATRRRVRLYVLVRTADGAYVDESTDLDAVIELAAGLEYVPTPEDWSDYGAWAEALDRAWLADRLDADTLLDDWDRPDPASEVDWDLLYADRDALAMEGGAR